MLHPELLRNLVVEHVESIVVDEQWIVFEQAELAAAAFRPYSGPAFLDR